MSRYSAPPYASVASASRAMKRAATNRAIEQQRSAQATETAEARSARIQRDAYAAHAQARVMPRMRDHSADLRRALRMRRDAFKLFLSDNFPSRDLPDGVQRTPCADFEVYRRAWLLRGIPEFGSVAWTVWQEYIKNAQRGLAVKW